MARRRRVLKGVGLARWLKHHNRVVRALRHAHVKVLVAAIGVTKKTQAARAIALAERYVGTKEYPAGSNLTLFGKWYGENGVFWCAIFVSFILSHAGRPFRWAYVPAIVAAARAGQAGLSIIEASQVNAAIHAGHVVLPCFDWNHDGEADHVGIAKRYDPRTGTIHTIEGNTGDSDWSNGGEVLDMVRPASLVQAFVKVSFH